MHIDLRRILQPGNRTGWERLQPCYRRCCADALTWAVQGESPDPNEVSVLVVSYVLLVFPPLMMSGSVMTVHQHCHVSGSGSVKRFTEVKKTYRKFVFRRFRHTGITITR